jgi:ornithine decarboxylase
MKIYTSLLGVNIVSNIDLTQLNSKRRWIYDKPALLHQANTWYTQIPWIKPYYAVKSNPIPYVINDLVQHKMNDFHIGLDVASLKETNIALMYTSIENTIYTNPHTIPHEINKDLQFNIKVVDSVGELELLNKNKIKCPILIRVISGVTIANINLNSKFGATREEAYEIIKLASTYGYVIKGVSFHIGSGGTFSRKEAFKNAYYVNALPVLNMIELFTDEKLILNIGGGFLYDTDLTDALGWTKDLPYEMIAEPGRYFSEPSHDLLVQVIAKTSKGIFIDNGVYHELNCYHRDHWSMPTLVHSIHNGQLNTIHNYKTQVIFGPTCDSYDTLGKQLIPDDIEVEDWILLPNMGAYTNAGMVDFNGIRGASSNYII